MDCSPLFYPATQGIQQSWHSKITPTCRGQRIELDSVRVTPQPSRRQTNSTSPHMSRTHSGFTLVRSPRAMIARKTHSFRVLIESSTIQTVSHCPGKLSVHSDGLPGLFVFYRGTSSQCGFINMISFSLYSTYPTRDSRWVLPFFSRMPCRF